MYNVVTSNLTSNLFSARHCVWEGGAKRHSCLHFTAKYVNLWPETLSPNIWKDRQVESGWKCSWTTSPYNHWTIFQSFPFCTQERIQRGGAFRAPAPFGNLLFWDDPKAALYSLCTLVLVATCRGILLNCLLSHPTPIEVSYIWHP